MRFSLNFIKEFLDIKIEPERLSQVLTMAGMEVESLQKLGSDWVFDIEVTTNRYDWLSITGISREIAAVLGKKLKLKEPPALTGKIYKARSIKIEDSQDCPYYIAKVLRQAKVAPGDLKVQQFLANCGLTSVNNVVDITNYCMLKWGNPLHAFDEDKIEGNVCVRRARKGEIFLGIDDKERELTGQNLVIADDKKVIALAGVMGSKNTEVTSQTKNVFLEAAVFSPLTVRRSRRAAGLDTEASYRFERMVSSDNLECACREAAFLMVKKCSGIYAGGCFSGKKPAAKRKEIILDLDKLSGYLGLMYPKAKVKKILVSLGCRVREVSSKVFSIMPPRLRFDIGKEVDVYEEVSRIFGYDKIPSRIPFLPASACAKIQAGGQQSYCFNNKLKDYAALLGFKEIVTYSVESKEDLARLQEEATVRIINPLRKQEASLRPSLLSGMLGCLRHNFNRGMNELKFFELADTYGLGKSGFLEIPSLALAFGGNNQDFFLLKGSVELLMKFLNIEGYYFKEAEMDNFTNSLALCVGEDVLGFVGKLDQAVKKDFDLKGEVFFCQINAGSLQKKSSQAFFKQFSAYPVVSRDISIALCRDVRFKEIEKIIRSKVNYLSDLQVVDVYKDKNIPSNQSAFTLRIFYQSPEKTLSSEEVDFFHNDIRKALSSYKGVVLR
ncbi:MAG: phenylalanine--tRNA ligase subunit beta [Candidatus Omnitrophica bacterium]|nr:phenylalanine--tRNA ligase subunit beta [Candidatus Omnitrophota bacterium]MDD5429474.1 phenylalanine--tRNA ligase subunit beta [Candidatus Omnitrophota bacterium]